MVNIQVQAEFSAKHKDTMPLKDSLNLFLEALQSHGIGYHLAKCSSFGLYEDKSTLFILSSTTQHTVLFGCL
jgi:hypothetical protein